jgi:membrane-associated phospholipid phosphatase
VRHEKLAWTAALVGVVFPGYFAIGLNQDPQLAHTLATRLDLAIPFSPAWMFAYGGVYTALLLPCFVVKCDRLFRRVALAYLFALLVSYATFAIFPVTTGRDHFRPDPASLDTTVFWVWGAALNYTIDPPMNCFPSLHVATMTLATLATWRADRLVGAFAAVVAVIISLSTLLVKQHYIADVLAGAALAFVGWAIFIRPYDPRGQKPEEIRQPRWGVLIYLGLYLFALFGVLYPLYVKGVRPWVKDGVAPVGLGR